MKTIHLTEDLEQFLHNAVHSGRYASEESVISDALERLRQVIGPIEASAAQSDERADSATPLTKHMFQRHLVEIGILDEPGDRSVDQPASPSSGDDEDEILSEYLIRDRLIEWLAGFLEK